MYWWFLYQPIAKKYNVKTMLGGAIVIFEKADKS
jgi:hypothetical protein